jgi:prophage regulatory protein
MVVGVFYAGPDMTKYANDFGNRRSGQSPHLSLPRLQVHGRRERPSKTRKGPIRILAPRPDMVRPRDPKVESPRRFLSIEQVAEELNIGAPSIRAPLKTGELRGIQIGGRGIWRIGRQDVEDYIVAAYQQTAARVAAGDLDDERT